MSSPQLQGPDHLAGRIGLRPGRPWPGNLHSTRRDWSALLACGQAPADVPDRLGGLYSLCGDAHRLCARGALRLARGEESPGPTFTRDEIRALHLETLREHARRLLIDWPRRLARSGWAQRWQADWHEALQSCSILRPGGGSDELAWEQWLREHVLHDAPQQWLAAWRQDPLACLDDWRRVSGWLPAMLDGIHDWAQASLPVVPVLRLATDADSAVELRRLGRTLLSAASEAPAFEPLWGGHCAETGAWARQDAPLDSAGRDTPWLRLGARLAELARLLSGFVSDDIQAASCLASGGVSWADEGAALAWVEMARGVLVHAVRLQRSGAQARVGRYAVLAPTEWNFHPQGALARLLAGMPEAPGADEREQLAVIVCALDPCVTTVLETSRAQAVLDGAGDRNHA